jgi:hypothetical protein
MTKPNPLNDYPNLLKSTDLDAINIVNNYKNIYDNYIIFSNQNNTSPDISILDNAATQIQKSFDDNTNIINSCIKDTRPYSNPNPRCTDNPSCLWSSDIENINLSFFILISEMVGNGSTSKNEYQFLPFFMMDNFTGAITNTPSNYSPYDSQTKPTYYLCSSIAYNSKSLDPKLMSQFQLMKARMQAQLTNKETRQNDAALISFLLYILLPTVIFVILILLYLKHSKSTPELAASSGTTAVPAPVTTTEMPVLVNTSSEPTPQVKTGGAVYDTINFITTLGLKLFRI